MPVHVGVPGVAEPQKLLALAARIGVADTHRFLAKNVRFVARLVRSGGFYRPDALLEGIAPTVADPAAHISGFHLYLFNAVEATETWRRAKLETLARDLKALMDRYFSQTLSSISDSPEGALDDGLPIDTARIHDRTEAALGNGALNVALAQGEIAVAAGQLRLANMAIRANDAELGVALGLDLSGSTIDARLVLTGAPGSGALEGLRPEIALALRGPFDAPKRTLDVAAFTSWLALRAIEEKDKHIDALQSGREIPAPPATSALPPKTQPRAAPQLRPPAAKAPPAGGRQPAAPKQAHA